MISTPYGVSLVGSEGLQPVGVVRSGSMYGKDFENHYEITRGRQYARVCVSRSIERY
jgi:hypothetical protein